MSLLLLDILEDNNLHKLIIYAGRIIKVCNSVIKNNINIFYYVTVSKIIE